MLKQRDPRRICSRIGFALAAMLVLYLGGQVGLMLLARAFAPWFVQSELGLFLLNDFALYLLGAPVFLLILRTIPDGVEGSRQKLRMNVGRYLLLLVLCLGAAYAVSIVTAIFLVVVEILKNKFVEDPVLFAEMGLPLSLLMGAVVPAFGEEFLFRYMLRRKLKGAGDKTYILLSAVCFGVFHMNFQQLFFTMVVGAVFAWIYCQTDVIWYPVSLHFVFNSVAVLLSDNLENMGLLVSYFGVAIVLIIGAIIILPLGLRFVKSTLRAPDEPGWPYKPQAAPRAGAMRNMPPYAPSAAYTAPLYAAGPGAPLGGVPGQPVAYQQQAPVPAGQYQYNAYGSLPQQTVGQQTYSHLAYGNNIPLYGGGYQAQQPAQMNNPAFGQGIQSPANGSYVNFTQLQVAQPTVVQPSVAQNLGSAELKYASYNNMPQNIMPPAYQNMQLVWPSANSLPASGGMLQHSMYQQGNLASAPRSTFKVCFANLGMVVYLLGGLVVVLLSLLL